MFFCFLIVSLYGHQYLKLQFTFELLQPVNSQLHISSHYHNLSFLCTSIYSRVEFVSVVFNIDQFVSIKAQSLSSADKLFDKLITDGWRSR